MKAPNPTFLKKAENIRGKRRLVTLILLAVLTLLTGIVIFVVNVASSQKEYSVLFPELVGRATDTTTTIEVDPTSKTTETTEETTESTEFTEDPLIPITVSDSGTDETTESVTETTSLAPDDLQIEDYRFVSPKTQIASHQRRAVLLDNMKNQVERYIRSVSGLRIGFEYKSLKTGEALGINELEPIVPAGTFAVPISLISDRMISENRLNPDVIITYTGHTAVNGSYIYSNYPSGKQLYYSTLPYLAVAYNDRVALEMMLAQMGGLEAIMPAINEISSFQPYDRDIFYADYSAHGYRGTARSTCYDMVNYMNALYVSYMNDPASYQRTINALAASQTVSPLRSSFDESISILHVYGRNSDLHGYTELAIIDGPEPIAVCIYVEGENNAAIMTVFKTIGDYVAEYITSCY
ncbi:MAG: class A beta-lactamase-related serine hydrolase [Saccharofermentans sp.]|nr:class A beta-lactamase-related serine hydrolase [Saccharofermentans sp.]